jgi:hypothetical protein
MENSTTKELLERVLPFLEQVRTDMSYYFSWLANGRRSQKENKTY